MRTVSLRVGKKILAVVPDVSKNIFHRPPFIPVGLVEKVWTAPKNGFFNITSVGWGGWAGAGLNVVKYRAIKDDKMVLVATRERARMGGNKVFIVAFPKPEFFGDFKKAAQGVMKIRPPSYSNPNAIASMILNYEYSPKGRPTKDLSLEFVQFHFKSGKGDKCLSRKLATKYMGAKYRLFKEAIRMAEERGGCLHITGHGRKTAEMYLADLRKVCTEMGFSEKAGSLPAEDGGKAHPNKLAQRYRGNKMVVELNFRED